MDRQANRLRIVEASCGGAARAAIGMLLTTEAFKPRLHGPAALFQHDLVNIAPHPILSRLDRAHERMLAAVEVLGRVLVARIIAAADVATRQAHAQMYPLGAHLQAFLAAVCAARDIADGVEMRADLGQWFPPVLRLADLGHQVGVAGETPEAVCTLAEDRHGVSPAPNGSPG
jgi:hypothetical protein